MEKLRRNVEEAISYIKENNKIRTFEDLIFRTHPYIAISPKFKKHSLVYFPNGYGVSVVIEKGKDGYFVELINRKQNVQRGSDFNKWLKKIGVEIEDGHIFTPDKDKVTDFMVAIQKIRFVKREKTFTSYLQRALDYDHCLKYPLNWEYI